MNPIEESIAGRFNKQIWSRFNKAVRDYQLILPGDRIAVCISGGKDSMLMAQCMLRMKRFSKMPFEVGFLVMDPGYSPANRRKIEENAALLGIPVTIRETRIFDSVENENSNPCFICARLRRGWLYKTAKAMGCNKIALGHHFDDVIETILMGMLYGSQMQTMLPKLHSENYAGMELIRPLYFVREQSVIDWAEYNGLEFIRCACRMTEVRQDNQEESKRAEIKKLLVQLRSVNPAVDMNIFRSAENVNLRKLISYRDGSEHHHFLDDYSDGITVRGTRNSDAKE